jgi:aminoglycoside phosphotransferase (APT) family kinase protein/SAM-dependent methyltransferase
VLSDSTGRLGCQDCAVKYSNEEGIYLLCPPFSMNGKPRTGVAADPIHDLVAYAEAHGWEDARARFTSDILAGRLETPGRSGLAAARARLQGTTWEDVLQDLIDPTRAGWMFLTDLRPVSRVVFLGPTFGAAPLTLARTCGHVVVFDASVERLKIARYQARAAGLDNLTFARIADPLHIPLADASVELAIVPGLGEWLRAVNGQRPMPAACGVELLRDLRRILVPGGQVYLGTDNRRSLLGLLGGASPSGSRYSPRTLPRAATEAGFSSCALYAPLPFRHKFHQVLDIGRSDRMNLCLDPYRAHGRALRPLTRAWDFCNRGGALERRLYHYLPALSAVLSTEPTSTSFAERLIQHLTDTGQVPSPGSLANYYVRQKGAAVLVVNSPDSGGVIVRLPLDERAEIACRRHHGALTVLAEDMRIPSPLRSLFPVPFAEGSFEGKTFFAEAALAGESGFFFYQRSARHYDRALTSAADVLSQLRRATEQPVAIDELEFGRLCGNWLRELQGLVDEESRGVLAALEESLRATLVGRVIPLGWCHGDYNFGNFLFAPGDRMNGILDFEMFDPRGLPLLDLLHLVALRQRRRSTPGFGTLFLGSVLRRTLPKLEASLLDREMQLLGCDEPLYRALTFACWLNHLRLRRDSWLVRSPSWLATNFHPVVKQLRSML